MTPVEGWYSVVSCPTAPSCVLSRGSVVGWALAPRASRWEFRLVRAVGVRGSWEEPSVVLDDRQILRLRAEGASRPPGVAGAVAELTDAGLLVRG